MSLVCRALASLAIIMSIYGCAALDSAMGEERPRPEVVSSPAAAQPSEYRLDAGDVISIRVYEWRTLAAGTPGEEDLRLERIRLDQAGIVNLPFGEFKAVGRTVKEFETSITESLRGRLLRNPRVSINIDEYRPFFVEGQVFRPGAYPYQHGLNVRKAVTIAGGLRERASPQKIFVIRDRDASHTRLKVDMNTLVGPGDTVTVEESFF